VYAWSVFNLPLENAFGWTKSDVAITFSLAIFFLGMSAAVMGHFVERNGPSKSGTVAAVLWGTGLMVASLGVKLGVIQVLWLGYGVIGGMGLGIGYITPVSTLVKWFPDRRGLATGLAIMGFGFGAAIGGPVYNYIMSDVAARKLGMPEANYRAGISNYNAAKTILKTIHLKDESAASYDMEQLLGAVKAGNNEAVLGMLPAKAAQDAGPSLVALQSALNNPDLAPFWDTRGSAKFKSAIGSGISTAFLFAGVAYLIIMFLAARYIERPPSGYMPARMKADVDAGKRKVIPDLAQVTANEAARQAPFYGLWIMMFINISCGIGIIYTASPLAQESIGLTPAQAAGVVGLMSVFNGLGRLGWASFSDYLGRANTYTLFFAIQIVAFWVLPSITSIILFQVVLYLILTCYGGGFATLPAFIGDLFGTRELGAIHGYVLTAWAMAGVFGPQMVARLYQATGSYEKVLHVFSGAFVVALIVSIMMRIHVSRARGRLATVAA
jgi:OFA family oxalate/formate antiporter-like MFS transporter